MTGPGDKQRFRAACAQALTGGPASGGIGTLGEGTLHRAVKWYIEPDEQFHEVKVGPFVADICGPQGIVEIQTGGFGRLRKKLDSFLDMGPVTVVYPVAAIKRLRWIDAETGGVSPPRKSPKRGEPWEVLPELYSIKPFLSHPNFRLCVLLLDLDELRRRNRRGGGGKRGGERLDRIPNDLLGELYLHMPGDYRQLLPDTLPRPFCAREFGAAAKLNRYHTGLAVNALCALGVIHVAAKEKNAYLYHAGPPSDSPYP